MDTTDTSNASAGAKDDSNNPLSEPQIERFPLNGVTPGEIIVSQSQAGTLAALDTETGMLLWHWRTGDRATQVALGKRHVYVSAATTSRHVWVEVDPPPGWIPLGGSGAFPLLHAPHVRVRTAALTALNASDGRVLWRVIVYGEKCAPPIYLAGDVVVTLILSFASKAREVIALDAATGALRWSHRLGSIEVENTRHVGPWATPRAELLWAAGGSVAINNSRVSKTDETTGETGDDEPQPYALLNASTGGLIWRGKTPPINAAFRSRATANGVNYQIDHALPAWPHSFVRALRERDGVELWRAPCANVIGMMPIPTDMLVESGQLFLLMNDTYATRVYALDTQNGRLMWRWRSPRWLAALYVLRQAFWRIQEAQRVGAWRSLWGDALRLRWRRPVQPASGAKLEARGYVYVANYQGLFALRAWNGRRTWHALPFAAPVRLYLAPDYATM